MANRKEVNKRSFETIREVKEAYLPNLVRSEQDGSESVGLRTRKTTEQTVRKHLEELSLSPE